ncbi:MAG: hypothetical protein FJ267_20415, partial [Planctomycetes bacterium]|nr:hypothetical protein [Planctomycetota bacterium]
METKDSFHKVSRHLRIVSGLTVVSRILGLLRDQAMSSAFGAGPILDSFTVAFRLPNLARVLLGEGALTTAFLPVVGRELREQGKESASRLTWAVFLVLASVLTLLVVVLEGILWSVGAMLNLSDEATLLRNLIAILLPYVILICLAAQVCAVLNAVERFAWSAIVPIVLNVVWLAGLWFLIPRWEDPSSQVYAMTWIIVVAGMIQLLCPLPVLWQLGFGFRYDWRKSLSRVMSIARDMLPVVFGLSVTQLNSVFDSLVAWGMTCPPTGEQSISFLPNHPRFPLAEGTATALYLGQRLYQFPLGVFGVALGTVLFPLLTAHAQQGDDHKLRA